MKTDINDDIKYKLLLLAGSAGITAAVWLGVKYIFPLTAPFILAFLCAVLLEGWVRRASRMFRGSRIAAATSIVAVITVIIIGIIGGIGYLAIQEIQNLICNYQEYYELCNVKIDLFCKRVDGWLGFDGGHMYTLVSDGIVALERQMHERMAGAVGTSFTVAAHIITKGVVWIASFFIMLISIVFISRDMYKFRDWKHKTRFAAEIGVLWQALIKLASVYFRTQLIIMCCTALICTAGLFIIRNPYAVVIGIGIGILDALPLFGTGTVLIPWGLVSLLGGRIAEAAILLTVYVITYFLREIMESKLMGDKLDIAPVTMMASIYIGLLTYGFFGFVLGPVSYCLIKAAIQLLKSTLESGKINSN